MNSSKKDRQEKQTNLQSSAYIISCKIKQNKEETNHNRKDMYTFYVCVQDVSLYHYKGRSQVIESAD